MKVKELAENLKTTTVELINKLSNVIFTEKITEEYEVSKDLEKKLAKMYGVSYPFKSNKPKSLNRPAVRIGSNKQEDELKSKSFSNQKPSKSSIPNNSKPVSNSLKSSEKRENQKNSVIQTNNNSHNNNNSNSNNNNSGNSKQQPKTNIKSQPRPKYVEEIIVPRVDEKILEKYGDYLEEDEYNLTRETRSARVKKAGSSENITDIKQRKKNSNKNKNNNAKKEKRTSNMPSNDKLEDHVLYFESGMSVMEVANGLGVSVTELVKKLFVSMGIMASATQALDRDTIELIAIEYDFELKDKKITDMTRFDELEVEDKAEDLLQALMGEQLAWALEDRMEIAHQVNILRESQGGKYVPFISAELGKALKLKLESSTSLQSIVRNLTGGSTTNIFAQFNQQNNVTQQNAITVEEARQIVLESQRVLDKPEEAKLLEDRYDIKSLPEVVATKQEGVDTSKEGLNLNKAELMQITDDYKGAMSSFSKEHHELRREIEMRIDPDEEDPELYQYEDFEEEEKEDGSFASQFLRNSKLP